MNQQRPRTDTAQTLDVSLIESSARRNPFVWRGYLTPDYDENAKDLASSFGIHEVNAPTYSIGRHPNSHLILTSRDVSREHARIHRIGADFYLEDLNSRHGTYVNGDRIVWCRLADGDVLQFGSKVGRGNTWYFDRAAIRNPDSATLPENSKIVRPTQLPADHLVVTFWGARGSIPTPGSHTGACGGNTTCVEIRFGEHLFVVDAGTGIRSLAKAWEREFGDQELTIHLFFSHLHWDHIQGFPFLDQAYQARNRIQIIGVDRDQGTMQELLKNQMQGLYFPVPMDAMQAQLTFSNLDKTLTVGGVRITKMLLPHPGGSYAYKFETSTGTLIFASDCELNLLRTPDAPSEQNSRQPQLAGPFPADFVAFFREADLLILDCQYTDELYQARIGWGHNAVSAVVDFCAQAQVKAVALTHHDPCSSDADIRHIVETVDARLKQHLNGNAPQVFAAREEMTVSVGYERRAE